MRPQFLINEGLAARLAVEGGAQAQTHEIRSALQGIGRDELRHFDLAQVILKWACARSNDARKAVAALLNPTSFEPPPGDDRSVDGGLDEFAKDRLWDEHVARAQCTTRSILDGAD